MAGRTTAAGPLHIAAEVAAELGQPSFPAEFESEAGSDADDPPHFRFETLPPDARVDRTRPADLAHRIREHEIPCGALPEAADESPPDGWARLVDEGANLGACDPWVGANLDRLAALAGPIAVAVSGSSLVHGDLRGDNALVTADARGVMTAVAVDWPFACRGAPFSRV